MRKEKGFSLIELMIVIAIILIIAAIAIPNLLQSRIAANEASAANSIRQMGTAQAAYYNAYPTVGYASALPVLGGPAPCLPSATAACLLDDSLATAVPGSVGKSGYFFQSTGVSSGSSINSNYASGASPISLGRTGNREFCSVSDGVLRSESGVGGPPVTTVSGCQAYPILQ